jgi:hypothetical protein
MSEKAKVYFFKVWDATTDTYDMPAMKSTSERIARVGGAIIPETEEEIDASLLDEDGRYDPGIGDAVDDGTAPEQVAVKPPSPAL